MKKKKGVANFASEQQELKATGIDNYDLQS